MIKRLNKKGSLPEDKFVAILLLVLFAVVMIGVIIGIRNYLNSSQNQREMCESEITGGMGVCKPFCDANELKVSAKCEVETDRCCVSTDKNMGDVNLPSQYGTRSAELDFRVTNIEVDASEEELRKNNCVKNGPDWSSLNCLSESQISVPIKIIVENYGTQSVQVKATPVIVIQGNAERVIIDEYVGKPIGLNPANGDPTEVKTIITIGPNQALTKAYWEIYPYVLCDVDQICKDSDGSSRGMYRGDKNNNMLTINFVDTLN